MPRLVVTIISFGFWFPLHAVWNRLHGCTFGDTLFLYRLAWRVERRGKLF